VFDAPPRAPRSCRLDNRRAPVEYVDTFLRYLAARGYVHHNATTSAWRFTAFGGGSRRSVIFKNHLDTAHRHRGRWAVGFGTDLKIMVSSVRIRVPPL
jgi:hypothetical protein